MTNQEQLVEYACQEGNVGVQFTLSAARTKEREAAANAEKLARAAAAPAIDLSRPLAVVAPTGKSSNALGMDFVVVSPGEFRMGCSVQPVQEKLPYPTNCNNDEKPTHFVQITKPFEIQTTETTQKQWQTIMGSNPSAYKDDVNGPVEQVSFEDVQNFLQKLNAQNDGYSYRLPTEAEWEYAARGGTSDPYAGPVREAWYNTSAAAASGQGSFNIGAGIGTHTVATKKPNPWGLYDMRGNVMEWVGDYYDPIYYSESPAADPKGPATGETRVVRGGSYHVYPWLTSVSVRTQFPETYSFEDVGFRVVREKKQ
jgi:formylglycine-generating enzyme required for sulfatase activity